MDTGCRHCGHKRIISWLKSESFSENGRMCRKRGGGGGGGGGEGHNKCLQFLFPQNMVRSILQQLHHALRDSHLGVAKALKKISSRFYWPVQQLDVEIWCKSCELHVYVWHGNLLLGNRRLNCRQNSPAIHYSRWQWTSWPGTITSILER